MLLVTVGTTAPALLAGAKTVVRATWSQRTAERYQPGLLAKAYDRSPQTRGRCMAVVRLVAPATYEPLASIPDSDYEAEGWQWMYEHFAGLRLPRYVQRTDFSWEAFERWRSQPGEVWVVRFAVEAMVLKTPIGLQTAA